MTEPRDERADEAGPPVSGPTAGALLRRARESRGLHIAALAAALKIPQRKLESLEADRYDELPDPAFTRALAKSACRVLKTDSEPVLALLPRPDGARLEQVSAGLNTPFIDSGASDTPVWLRSPVTWIVLLLGVAAVAVTLWPRALPSTMAEPAGATRELAAPPVHASAPAPASVPASAPASAAGETADASAPVAGAGAMSPAAGHDAAAAPVAGAGGGEGAEGAAAADLRVEAAQPSWLQVLDARSQVLASRTLGPGKEPLTLGPEALDGRLPLQVVVGNAQATRLWWRGQEQALAASARGNVARVELR